MQFVLLRSKRKITGETEKNPNIAIVSTESEKRRA